MKSVYLFTYVLCLILFVQGEMTDQQKQMAQMLHNNCVKETGVSEDVIIGTSKGHFPDDDKLKCYMKCIYVQIGVLSEEDWSFDSEALIEMVPEEVKEVTTEGIKKCTPLSGDSGCDKAFNLNKCFYANSPQTYLVI